MKKKSMMILALAALATTFSIHAENVQAMTGKATEAVASRLTADEQAFAAKLSDQNRKSFCEKLSAEQRKSAMIAVKNGAGADEAVQNLTALKEMKDSAALANAESAAAEKASSSEQASK